jgi:hypothetical protein
MFSQIPILRKEIKCHYIIWWLDHNPFQEDLDIIQTYVSN